ncbi:tyrosine-type recombinase/integrase [Halococcoides cellulosivorans]|uniref:Site-specific integrase n=1 Tax=Halococcoides cellulosivorans TaxID=1679096 RepID=A0A2R4X3X2_9EURY|nr:tyrosine-type recombinase/integrase [Halococcoides cellulosivorans]AWB28487.1 site-specific integrase [Halococcoides cellulosivorans]
MPTAADTDQPRWTLLDLEGLAAAYWDEIAPVLRAEGRDPETDRPSYEWLSENGCRGLTYALREYHDLSFSEFWNDHLDTESPGYDWEIDHRPTIDALERYLDRQQQRLSWSESTVQTHRYRLAQYVRAYEDVNGTSDVLTPVARDSDVPASVAVDACWDTFDALDRTVDRTTLRRIYKSTSSWYSTLVSRREAALNPTDGLDYDWGGKDRDGDKNPPLAPEHVRALYDAAADTRERLLVVALCAWGLRSGEVAALHRRQLNLEDDHPHVAFDERKNGPGTVAVIYGADVARDRIVTLVEDDDWNGYLFPSDRSASGHRTRGTIGDWFDDLADRAGLPEEINGREPIPQMARRFWYDRYSDTVEQLVEHQISEIAEEQGSASADVVWQDYLEEDRRRELRREFMREKLSEAFGD